MSWITDLDQEQPVILSEQTELLRLSWRNSEFGCEPKDLRFLLHGSWIFTTTEL